MSALDWISRRRETPRHDPRERGGHGRRVSTRLYEGATPASTGGTAPMAVTLAFRRGVALRRLVDMLALRRPAAGPARGWARPSDRTMSSMAGTEVSRPGR